jgi:hypothetical protein
MPKGGARARSGPAPDPNALRRDRDNGDWLDLPAAGREGDPPDWPLSAATARELELWGGEWRRPQAIVWERNGQELEVAMYVRAVVDAESPRASVASRTLVRQLMDSLGLTVPGLLRNRWRIVDQAQAPAQAGQQRTGRRGSARERLKVVKGGA